MSTTPTEVATAAARRFRVLRERATTKLAKARSDAATLRARVQRESTEMMAEAKRRKEGDEPGAQLVSPWPDEQKTARYQFDDSPDDTPAADRPAPDPDTTARRPAPKPVPAARRAPDEDDDNMSTVDTWLT
jgi:hypothetical protein